MGMTDPIADMLTRIRNMNRMCQTKVSVPKSKLKLAVANALKREGFIEDVKVAESDGREIMRVFLKREKGTGQMIIRSIQRVSKPGRRVYVRAADVKPVLKGMGISVVSTPKGVLSDRECRREKVGGEILCTVW